MDCACSSSRPSATGPRRDGLEHGGERGFQRLQIEGLGEEAPGAQLSGHIPAAYGRHDEDRRTALHGTRLMRCQETPAIRCRRREVQQDRVRWITPYPVMRLTTIR